MELQEVPGISFSASSEYGPDNAAETGAMENLKYGWAPTIADRDNGSAYLQVDLGKDYMLCAIITRGSREHDEWVKTFKVQLSIDGTSGSWFYYQQKPGVDQVTFQFVETKIRASRKHKDFLQLHMDLGLLIDYG